MKNTNDFFQNLKSFCEVNEQFRIAFEILDKTKKLEEEIKCERLLHYISRDLLIIPQNFSDIYDHFIEHFPKLLFEALFSSDNAKYNGSRHICNSVLLGKTVRVRDDLEGYALKYFTLHPAPFDMFIQDVPKKRKIENRIDISDLDIVESCYFLLKSNPAYYRNKWNWSVFIKKYLNHSDSKVKWIACLTLSILLGMNERQLENLISSHVNPEEGRKFACCFNLSLTISDKDKTAPPLDQHPTIYASKQSTDLVTNISGVYIPTVRNIDSIQNPLVEVPSTYSNLRKIALGLASKKAICLQGPVGSGKSSLIDYLACKTGRKLGENFIKVQLGDQTDSKMLLGTYRCTDVPGEFVWQPGVLTQAVLEGNWLLLEDIDSASMDIASVLTSLIENNSLTVPGYRDSVPVTFGFQLFVTQRFVSTITGHHKKHSNAMTLLEKYLLQINIDPLSTEELKQILNTHFPKFQSITDRMLAVFKLFSLDSSASKMISLPRNARLISTRDFFKWCLRAIIDFDIKSQASALKVLQDAIDVFCCSFTNSEEALNLARQISTHLGIINQKADYFFKSYKPNMKLTTNSLIIGRAVLARENNQFCRKVKFSFTRPTSVLLERIMCCINLHEPVLLVGETGTGKTSSVQYLAHTIGQKLVVINMNQQSDSADLLGGFKPVDLKFIVAPIRREFEQIFCDYFQVEPNKKYLSNIALCFNTQRWSDLVKLMNKSYQAAVNRLTKSICDFELALKTNQKLEEEKIRKNEKDEKFLASWKLIGEKLHKLDLQLKQKSALAFAFIEGSLVKAVENGYWVLLDEINLANAETLECLSGLLEGSKGSICLLERGDKQPVVRHPNFTLFACMNPSTDVGKKDLPAGLRNRFTEFFVDELNDKSDLLLLVNNYLEAMSLKEKDLNKIVEFYLRVRKEASSTLTDGLGHKPHFSLRSLCRALVIASKNPCGMFKRSLYEAFCLSFLTQLDSSSYQTVEKIISSYLIGDEKALKAVLNQPIPEPQGSNDSYSQFEGYWIRKGSIEPNSPEDYILTESVRKNLKDLVRVVSIGKLPVLLQGDTSVGKTSLITYLAKSSGNKCVRINNHEHTDLQEYIGSYVADSTGRLIFKEGLLVEAMRKGHWIILDELNLAPTDVLEALNRVLDDNRELFIPETQETIKADPNFMLFATQNPPGAYGGRKMLSRAFRNRFVELHFNEIPPAELEFILHKRCQMAPSYAKKMISVMTDLQTRRRGSAAFAGKQGFITLRDLFRWGERYRLAQNVNKLYDWDQHLADEGYLVLAGRVRKAEEKMEIMHVLQKHLKREVKPEHLFTLSDKTSSVTKHILQNIKDNSVKHKNIVWTYNMRQLAILVAKALEFKEPVLLVGETGGGKTTVCKLIADNNEQELITVNCHMHTESGDFIGGLRPVRDHSGDDFNKLFEWVDGPLLQAMINGHIFLADEISLADDSVLERLNSLLEPERSLLLAEKGIDLNNSDNSELIIADPNFYFIGTMNPGGDFGKKELSPALRNRFTEIWCESCTDRQDLVAIIEKNVKPELSLGNQQDGSSIGNNIMDFVEWFQKTEIGKRFTISIRDILTWVGFLNICGDKVDIAEAYIHGASLTFLDSLGSGATSTESLKLLDAFRNDCEQFLINQVKQLTHTVPHFNLKSLSVEKDDRKFGIPPFFIELGSENHEKTDFSFNAPTTIYNTLRLLRGMQLNKAILLEGSSGVGKTSLVVALAKSTGHKIFRVNLSDQTDISDLFGADLPVEGGSGGQFSWRDGPLLQALKDGSWILLDELNLASQSVLEGLNACLDHRGEIFIPELGKTFYVKPGTTFFACQNPLKQGGSRRGLPKSFLNRFIQVYVNSLTDKDLKYILSHQYDSLPAEIIQDMIDFNSKIVHELDNHSFGNKGAPWECNLRDLTRWCEAMVYHYNANPSLQKKYQPESIVQLIYSNRMRTLSDKEKVEDIFEDVFRNKVRGTGPIMYVSKDSVYVGDVALDRQSSGVNVNVLKQERTCLVLRSQLQTLRSLAYCVNLNWMAILVGSSGCGKSSVVKTLANLAGKALKTLPVTSAMDTTDILGGFEQTDYSRHLDEIAKETQRLVLETLQELLIDGKADGGVELLMQWESYLGMDDAPKQTMEEDSKLFLRKIAKLSEIWDKLEPVVNRNNFIILKDLREKSQKISNSVKEDGSLNAGGKFEWVDSILIKCLQDGSWLLIDNVNLCSSAVLDRLNGLLEPQGILTISERGVDQNGKMIEVRPHKDFRLFLTMDPKNGEISRAMRNRGVEIYMLNEKECHNLNVLDIKSLINLEGLKETRHINSLLKTHDFISDLTLGEKPNINEILHASSLIAQQINHGVKTPEAFSSAIIDVYYKTRSAVEFNCNDTVNVFKNEIKRILDDYSGAKQEQNVDAYNENITLKTQNILTCSTIEKVKQQFSVLYKHLTHSPDTFEVNNLLTNLLVNYFSISSLEDLEMRRTFSGYNLIKNPSLMHLKKKLNEIVSKFKTVDYQTLPQDYRWIPETLYKIKNSLQSNKLNLALHLTSNYFREETQFNVIKGKSKTLKEVTLLDYLHEKRKKKIQDKFNNIILNEYLDLMKEFDEYLHSIPERVNSLHEGTVIQILLLVFWRHAFQRCTLTNIKNMNSTDQYNMLVNLSVHYKWFFKYAIQQVSLLTKVDVPNSLKKITTNINSTLEKQFSCMQKIGKNYQKLSNKPPPFINAHQLKVIPIYNEISSFYNLCEKPSDIIKIVSFLKEEKELRPLLVELKSELNYDFTDASRSIDSLKLLHEKYANDGSRKHLSKFEIQLLPIIDYISNLSVRDVMKTLPKIELSNFVTNSITTPTDLIGALTCYNKTKDLRLLHEITKSYYLYLLNSPAIRPNKYLLDDEDREGLTISNFNPKLTYYLSILLDSNKNYNSAIITLGNFRERLQQHNHLSLILWRNLYQISEKKYDYLFTEKEYILQIFKIFIIQLTETLDIEETDGKTLPEIINQCIQALDLYKNIGSLTDINNEMLKIKKHLQNCSVKIVQLKNSTELNNTLLIISDLCMELSFIKAVFNSKLSLIDPLAKKTLKKEYCLKSIDFFKDLKKCYELQNHIYSNSCKTLHSYSHPVQQIIEELELKNEDLDKYVAVRSTEVLYESVLRVVNHAFNTILSEDNVNRTSSGITYQVLDLISALSAKEEIDYRYFINKLNTHKSLIPSYESLIHEWSNFCNTFPDIIEPLLSNVVEFLYGLRMKVSLLGKLITEYENMKIGVNVQKELLNLVKLPLLDETQSTYGEHIETITSQRINNFVKHILENENLPHIKEQESFRLLKCGIQESFNYCLIDAKAGEILNKTLFMKFVDLLNVFVSSWNTLQEQKEKQEKEGESLYKTRTKCDDKPEEQQIEEELKDLFPNYHDLDFSDFHSSAELKDDQQEEQLVDGYKATISYQDLKFVVELHMILTQNFTKTEWLNPTVDKNVCHNFIDPLLEKYKVFTQILNKSINCLDYSLDMKLITSFNVLLSVIQRYGQTSDISDQTMSPTRMSNKKRDFYRDPDVEEVKSCYHILEELRLKINELLDEWPEQPTLKTINLVIDRIYKFDITSPISRFLTGFEILLSKCHEWEEVAHSGVSLSQYYQNITQQIITWRKLELTMWKDLLNQTYERLNEPITKWWLYIYNIMEQFIVEKKYSETELIETLQTFLTKSNLAEFEGRLNLLYIFHCHVTYLERSKETELFISILWNVYSYFQQFSLTISKKIKDLRAPIEKKLKDYVKIVRWKDINYWAIKHTVDKSHKTLHSYMREFKDVLQQPVTPYLVNTNSDNVEIVGIWDRPQRQSPKTYHYTLDPDAYLAKQSLTKKIHTTESKPDEGILSKVESYFLKSRKLCKEIIMATNYPSLVQTLDGFVTDVIETSSHLQSLEVDTTLPKEKQKSQAKNILQQKHRALADLFKSLSKIGLSFRTGVIESKLKAASEDFTLRPVDLSAAFDHINYGRQEEKILTIWDSCEMYYTRSLMRTDILDTALNSPAKDLGLQNIERCKGFSAHLMNYARKQKNELINSTRIYYYLRFYAKQLNEACEGKNFLHIEIVENTKNLLKNVTIVMNQCKIILNSCPIEGNFGNDLLEVPVLKSDVKECIEYKHDSMWSKATGLINNILNAANKLNSILQRCKGNVPSVEYDLVYTEFVPISDLSGIENDLINMYKDIENLQVIFGNVSVNESLSWLMKLIAAIGEQFEKQYSDTLSSNIEEFKKQIQKFCEKLLMIVQNLYKRYIVENKKSEEKEKENEDLEEDKQLQEDHLKTLIMENLFNDVAALEMKDVLKATHDISNHLLKTPPKYASELKSLVYQCLPLLNQAIHLCQYFITQQVSAYRVTCKMNSILLNIFIDLVSKGFCVPPEFSDDMDSEGVSKPSDGLGLGEGQGERDVSDKIESEDQLDDAQPAGQEKKNDEDPDCKESEKGIEMSEDFDSKLQDKEKKEDDDDEGSNSDDSDANEQMGETEKGAEQLDQEIWGSDNEDDKNDDEASENKEEKGNNGEEQGDDQLGAKEDNPSKTDSDDKDKNNTEEKESTKKDINEMEEPEYDDDQIDPHHGKQPELPEPEPMDLPEDLQLDEGQDNDNENDNPEENPFDIDTMKEENLTKEENVNEDKGKDEEDEEKHDEEKDFSSDDEEVTKKEEDLSQDDGDTEKNEDHETKESHKNDGDSDHEEEAENDDNTALDQSQSNQENIEAMEATGSDNVEASQSDNQKSNQPVDELCQEDAPDNEGMGQSQMEESATGHSAQTTVPQEVKTGKRELEEEEIRKQKPGESDSQRSLGDVNEPVRKKLKSIDSRKEEQKFDEDSENNKDEAAEMYQHIKEANKEPTTQILDVATKEQAEDQKSETSNKEDEVTEEPTESSHNLPSEEEQEDIDMTEIPTEVSEKTENKKNGHSSRKQHPEGDILDETQNIDVEGDIVQTITVPRNAESTHHTQYSNIFETTANRLSLEEINNLRSEVEKQFMTWNEPPPTAQAEHTWQKISSVTASLAQDLSEQLRLVLEPTQASRLKGDFRTGRRINMRKVIPYIASQFRKDKIWLRRTKPSKREYQIVLAIDDSSSMADNHSKELAFESVSLISKALTLLESGQLSVISFGETVEVLHKLTDQFTDKSGVKLLQKFRFDQGKTYVAKLVDFATEVFNQSQVHSSALNAKLLVIVSDGRGVFSEGETYVRQAIRRAKLSGIFMVFVIIDNPENKNSVLDIRMPVFKDGKLLGIENYMDTFPFSFYIILRDINSLPNVLSDALRQWFEIVSNLDKQ